MRFTVLAAIASAALVAGTPLRRQSIPPLDLDQCPAEIAALVQGCFANPTPDCFDRDVGIPPETVERIRGCFSNPTPACFLSIPEIPVECRAALQRLPPLPGFPGGQ